MDEHYDISVILERMKPDAWYDTFICKENMAVGVLRLKPNEEDLQEPHLYDEIYYIISGDGYLRVEDKNIAVKEGRVIFVPAYAKHKFHSNTRELVALYVFAGEDKDISDS